MKGYTTVQNNTDPNWWRDAGMRKSMFHIVVLYTCVYSLGYDGSLLNGLQAIPAWQSYFGKPTGYTLGLIAASYYLPKIPATFVIAALTDRYGRKCTLYLGAFWMLAGALFGAFCQNRGQLIGSRVFLGIGTACAQIGAASMVPELAHPRLRHFAGSFLNTTYFIGSIFGAWLTFGMIYYPGGGSWSWRLPTLLQGFGPIILALGVWFIPESPRWLIRNGREEEAHVILATYHANGKMDDPLVLLEIQEIQQSVRVELQAKSTSWLNYFETVGNKRRFFMTIVLGMATQLVGNGIISYYLVPVLNQVGIVKPAQTAGINGGLTIWSWFCALTGASLVERAGRRTLFLISAVGMIVCFCIMAGVAGGYATTHVQATGVAIVPIIFIFNAFYALALTPLPMLYVPEITPLTMRAKGASLLLLSQNVSQTFNQFVNPIALKAITWKYYIVYIVAQIIFLVIFWFFLRETKGLTVEEAAVVYDSDDVKGAAMEAERKLRDALETSQGLEGHGELEEKDLEPRVSRNEDITRKA